MYKTDRQIENEKLDREFWKGYCVGAWAMVVLYAAVHFYMTGAL